MKSNSSFANPSTAVTSPILSARTSNQYFLQSFTTNNSLQYLRYTFIPIIIGLVENDPRSPRRKTMRNQFSTKKCDCTGSRFLLILYHVSKKQTNNQIIPTETTPHYLLYISFSQSFSFMSNHPKSPTNPKLHP